MNPSVGAQLLQAVSNRVIAQFLRSSGHRDVVISNRDGDTSAPVDITCDYAGRRRRIKVKSDSYFGVDAVKIADRNLSFYRADMDCYAFESISNHMTREPGWMFNSDADDLYYFYIALSQTEEEIAALLSEPDAVFFSELLVDRDQLLILPMGETRGWFEANFEKYTPRPVSVGEHAAWYRLIPRQDIDKKLKGIRVVGSVFADLAV
ncbi:MAG: hypothetical protein PF636_08545 [Actinomycetota bacterium]|nr:hypothetical protein [Actinomycetota bacterium]